MREKRKPARLLGALLALILVLVAVASAAGATGEAQDESMSLGAKGSAVVWHEKSANAGYDGVTKIGLIRRDSFRYRKAPVFDVLLGYSNNDTEVQTSFMDGGYGSAAVLGEDITKGKSLDATKDSDLGSGVSVGMKYTGIANSTIIRVDYTVSNSNGSAQTVTLGGTVDTCIAKDDYATITPFDSLNINGTQGLVSKARSGEFLGFAMDMKDGGYWYGRWTYEQSNDTFPDYINKVGKEDNLTEGYYDSCMSWKWTVSVPANGSVIKSCYIGVGDTKLGDDPAALETIGKYRVTLNPNASGDNSVSGLPDPAYVAAAPGGPVNLPDIKRDGYTFSGWYTEAVNGTKADKSYTPTGDVTLYAHWTPIFSTVNVRLKLDSEAWPGQTVALYSAYSIPLYTLAEGSDGVYSSDKIVNGTYYVWVNGERYGQSVSVRAVDASTIENVSASYKNIAVTTRLDGDPSAAPGEVTLRGEYGLIAHTLSYDDAAKKWVKPVANSTLTGNTIYDVYVGGVDSGKDVSANAYAYTIDYYTMTVKLTDDEAWTNASVTLRETDSAVSAILVHSATEGKAATYTRIMQGDEAAEPTEYKVFVDNTDTHKTVKRTAEGHSAEVSFYTATLNVSCSALPDTFSARMSNGVDSYSLARGTTTGTATAFSAHVLDNSEHQTYTAIIGGASAAGTNAITFDSENKTKNLTIYVLTYKNGSDTYGTAYVRSGALTTAAAAPNVNGQSFDCWSETAAETGYTAFDFTQKISADKTLYSHFLTPTVRINGYLRTDADGKANESGTSFRMPNFTIYGFTGETVGFINFEVSNVSSIKLSGTLPTGVNAELDGAVGLLTFKNAVSAEDAQQTVRDCVVVTPASGQASEVTATVYSAK